MKRTNTIIAAALFSMLLTGCGSVAEESTDSAGSSIDRRIEKILQKKQD